METSTSSESGSSPGTVSKAVREHLQQLCLREFPCGTGSWNKSRFRPQTWRTWKELVPREEETVSAGEETVEALLGLVRSHHSPWALLKGSSAEDHFLRELAIQSPLMIKDTFFYSYFRSLRVVDKGVSLVDKDLLKFLNLEELVLSANQIMEIDATNLPPTLKVLELYGNLITSMSCLCMSPPPRLQHLGLGHNKLLGPLESLYITSNHWPNLVSLDLGFNDLTDLQGMMTSLSTLQHLRLLVLQGNPLALVPYYRGFTIDCLARLCVLDDVTVSPNEKHQFRGLSINGDLLAREAQFVVTIGNVKGVLDTSILDPEPGPEGPFITYSYYVTYDFVEDEEGEGISVLAQVQPDTVLAEIVKPASSAELLEEEIHDVVHEETPKAREQVRKVAHKESRREARKEARKEIPEIPKETQEEVPEEGAEVAQENASENATEMTEESIESGGTEPAESESSVHSVPLPQSIDSSEELAKLRPRIDPRLGPSPGTVLFSTVRKPWADVIPCDYVMQHTLKDLVPVKAFLLAGTTVTIVEEKILSWPVVPPPVEIPVPAKKGKGENDIPMPAKKGKGETDKRKEKDKKGKVEEPPKDQKGLKKKKEPPRELRQDPPVLQVLGSGMVVLEPLLVGEPMVSTVCNFGVVRTLETDKLIHSRDSKKTKKAAKKEKSKSAASTFESEYQPQPLTVEVQIQLAQCRSAEEALRCLIT